VWVLDKIIVLDEGRVVESGSHAELLSTDGPYSKMWKDQLRTLDVETPVDPPSQ
jgi:ABC-type multidrug transport system fused ATPase/permease subunit